MTAVIFRVIRRLVKGPRVGIGRWRGVVLYVRHGEMLVALLLVFLARSGASEKRAGTSVAFLVLVVVHELGHAWVARLCGWPVRALTFGVTSGECEFRRDGDYGDEESRARNLTMVSWGGVMTEFMFLGVALLLKWFGWWPAGDFAGGVFSGFTWLNGAVIVWNLLPFPGHDGEHAWLFLKPRFGADAKTTTGGSEAP